MSCSFALWNNLMKRDQCAKTTPVTAISPWCKDKTLTGMGLWTWATVTTPSWVEANFYYCVSGTYCKSIASSAQRQKLSTCRCSCSQILSKSIEANHKLCNLHTTSNRFHNANEVFPMPKRMATLTQEPFSVAPNPCLGLTLALSTLLMPSQIAVHFLCFD